MRSMLNKRPKMRPEVWEHFDETPDGQRAICKYCAHSLSGNSSGGTSHLKRHLVICNKCPKGDVNQPLTWEAEMKKAIMAEIPFATSDCKKVWQSLMGSMDIEKEICKYYEHEKEKLAIELRNLTSRISFSFEILEKQGYISITAHYIDGDFNLVRKLIGFKKLTDFPSESCTVDAIKNCISDWKLGDKIFSFIGGGCSGHMKESLRENFSSKMLLNGEFITVRCCKEEVTDFYSSCKVPLFYQETVNIGKFIKAVKIVPSRLATFNEIAGEKGLTPINKDWLNEYAERSWGLDSEDLEDWKPAVKMFEEAVVYKDVFSRYAEMVREGDSELENLHPDQLGNSNSSCMDTRTEAGFPPFSESNLCTIDWKRVEDTVQFSDFVFKIIDGLSSSNYPTSNLYFLNIVEIEDIMEKLNILSIETETSDHEKEYYNLYEELLDLEGCNSFRLFEMANALDPRYKLALRQYRGDNMMNDFGDEKTFFEEVFCAYAEEEIKEAVPACIEYTNREYQGSSSNSAHRSYGASDRFSMYIKGTKHAKRSELYKYLGDELVDLHDASFNLLAWWKQNRPRYSVLSRMVRDVLAVPTCVYSIKDYISSDFKAFESVSPQLLEAVVCSKDWILSDIQSIPESNN